MHIQKFKTYLLLHLPSNCFFLHINSVSFLELSALLAFQLFDSLCEELSISFLQCYHFLHDLIFESPIASINMVSELLYICLHVLNCIQNSSMGCLMLAKLLMESAQRS